MDEKKTQVGGTNYQPRWITFFDSRNGIHTMVPKDWIKAVAPAAKQSEIIDSLDPIVGKTLVTFKDSYQMLTPHTLEEWVEKLGSDVMCTGGEKDPKPYGFDGSGQLQLVSIADKSKIQIAPVIDLQAPR